MRFSILVAALFLAGCETAAPVKVVGDNYCRLAGRITWSVDDTKLTQDQIRVHNSKYRRVCR